MARSCPRRCPTRRRSRSPRRPRWRADRGTAASSTRAPACAPPAARRGGRGRNTATRRRTACVERDREPRRGPRIVRARSRPYSRFSAPRSDPRSAGAAPSHTHSSRARPTATSSPASVRSASREPGSSRGSRTQPPARAPIRSPAHTRPPCSPRKRSRSSPSSRAPRAAPARRDVRPRCAARARGTRRSRGRVRRAPGRCGRCSTRRAGGRALVGRHARDPVEARGRGVSRARRRARRRVEQEGSLAHVVREERLEAPRGDQHVALGIESVARQTRARNGRGVGELRAAAEAPCSVHCRLIASTIAGTSGPRSSSRSVHGSSGARPITRATRARHPRSRGSRGTSGSGSSPVARVASARPRRAPVRP